MTISPDGPIILIVDDDPDFREILRGVLQKNNFQTLEAKSAQDLSSFVDSSEFDCVLLDYRLEGETAFHVMDVLAKSSNADAPVIMMTGSTEQSVAIKAFRFGVADFLPKTTLGFRDLGNVIQKAIENKRQSVAERTELKRLREERVIDIVTGTFSRTEFERRVESHVEAGPSRHDPVIVLSLDAYYRETLSRFGQKNADALLREAITRLRAHTDSEDIWGRTGDGTFACLSPSIKDRASLQNKLETLQKAASFIFRVGAAALSVEPELHTLIASDGAGALIEKLADLSSPSGEQTATQPAFTNFASADDGTNDPTGEQVERRRVRRTRVLKAAKIIVGPSTIDCAVRDMSELGLRLRLEQYTPLPSRFAVRLSDTGEVRDVGLRWQRDRECGVEFV
ncbi:response regulator [Notoacmeibacter sp. MSK16QG-6]|uniref:GGDEF domain-containing response regulator n=1 Tax=Notoacmeibacter sp. MSK16QG-6 TaxID=2957982 RepID=UPI00209E037F|nr:response regulator [Notoacmeibacter sp. MSK16QG-6]